MADFHFIRPLWLLLLIAALLMPLVLKQFRSSDSGWTRIIPARLLTPLIQSSSTDGVGTRSPALPMMLAIALLSIALAGPSWRESPTPLQQQDDSLVVVLDLSLSMLATDVEPDRLTVAKRKIRDILEAREGSLTALVVYSADAHVVTPLTDDRQTIEGMLGVLDPVIMPAAGNRADLGIERGLNLLEQGAPGKGRLLLISDDVADRYQNSIRSTLTDSPYSLSTLVVGTPKGGPIPLERQGFIRDQGEIVITRADPDAMASVARSSGGQSHPLTITSEDIRALELRSEDAEEWQDSKLDVTVKRWQDDGYWLLWLAIPFALLGWRRGAVIVLAFIILPMTPRSAMAQSWDGLWQREDQRAPEMIRQNPEQAAQTLSDPDLRGSALYRSGDYESAIESFSKGDAPSAEYNRANALAKAGKLEEAVEAYDQFLEKHPDHEDARFNRDLVKDLLEQQQQQQNQSDQQNDQSGDSSNQQQQNGQQGSENQNSDQNPSSNPQNQSESQGEQQQQNGENSQQSQQEQNGQQDQQQEQSEGQSQSDTEADNDQTEAQAPAELDTSPLTQGQEQWLRRVPDDPGGLLRRKFLQQYQQRNTQTDEGDTPW
ncbi:VWA domain-containing protein [Marinobacter sp. CHS3-4]|uniref:VWA domain-containing protein n=1 Tax=Marinobacter sp. CHS3-4 TaxID=3045174 RepID=UPI0024B61472|nr:VWA domain-containing protein [Marinobacter sp. CHS3-4]MDI9245868.1 VWA domain-containing protein [Marinobacter sp. CHS3-4]